MESAKPIEPGCLAIVTFAPSQPHWVGRFVTPLRRHDEITRYWQVNEDLNHDGKGNLIEERGLMRIEDPDLQKQIEQEKELVHD